MPITVVPSSAAWPGNFIRVARDLRRALRDVPVIGVEHIGSTSVPGLAAKPILDIDVIVEPAHVQGAISALVVVGYRHLGDFGFTGRDAVAAPDDDPLRHVYVCEDGSLHLRNHLAVRDVLRQRPDLRNRYGALKKELARDPDLSIEAYMSLKSDLLQEILASSSLSTAEKGQIYALNRALAEPETRPTSTR